MAPREPKYFAFISYSHMDGREARRLQRYLVGFRIEKRLVGRRTSMGCVPKSLEPVFLDRLAFEAGRSLTDETRSALEDSAALILLASPHAKASRYVNEEIRLFRWMYPDRPVVPLIIAGPHGLSEADVFPDALLFQIDADGVVTDRPQIVLAADKRDGSDGPDLALSKVIARLIGVTPDEVFQSVRRERLHRARIRRGTVAAFIALSFGAGLAVWKSERNRTEERIRYAASEAKRLTRDGDAVSAVKIARLGLEEAGTRLNTSELQATLATAMRAALEKVHLKLPWRPISALAMNEETGDIIASGPNEESILFKKGEGFNFSPLPFSGSGKAFIPGTQFVVATRGSMVELVSPTSNAVTFDTSRPSGVASVVTAKAVPVFGIVDYDGTVSIYRVDGQGHADLLWQNKIEAASLLEIAPSGSVIAISTDRKRLLGTAYADRPVHVDDDVFIIRVDGSVPPRLLQEADRRKPTAIAFSRDAQSVVVGYATGKVVVFDTRTSTSKTMSAFSRRGTERAHGTPVSEIVVNDAGRLAATRARDEPVAAIWSLDSGELMATLATHTDTVTGLRWHGADQLLTSSRDGSILVWDNIDQDHRQIKTILKLRTERNEVSGLYMPPSRGWFATTSDDDKIRLWDTRETLGGRAVFSAGEMRSSFWTGAKDSALALAHYDEEGLSVATRDGVALRRDSFRNSWTVGAAASESLDRLVSYKVDPVPDAVGEESGARLWRLSDQSHVADLSGITSMISDARFIPETHQLLLGEVEGTVSLWDAASGQQIWSRSTGRKGVTLAVIDGDRFGAVAESGAVVFLDRKTGAILTSWSTGESNGMSLMSVENGRALITSWSDDTIERRDYPFQKVTWKSKIGAAIKIVTIDDGRIAALTYEGDLVILNVTIGKELKSIKIGSQCSNGAMQFIDGSSRLIVGCNHSDLITFDTKFMGITDDMGFPPGGVNHFDIRADGSIVVAFGMENQNGFAWIGRIYTSRADILAKSSEIAKLRPDVNVDDR